MIVSIPDLCTLTYFVATSVKTMVVCYLNSLSCDL